VSEAGGPPDEPWADHLETHISSVFFAGAYAYKQLKPMTTAFLDYGTIEQRRAALADELALNRRIAPDVYLGCVPITADDDVTLDHLMVMRRLPHRRRLSALVGTPEFEDQLRAVARTVAAFHAALDADDEAAALASVDAERSRWHANLTELRDLVHLGCIDDGEIEAIGHMADTYLAGRTTLFEERIASGLARDGHGDLLAADIFCLDDGPRILDCLAFDATLRKGDVLADIAVLDDAGEVVGIEARAADEGAVDVGLGHQLGGVARLHRPAVLDAHRAAASRRRPRHRGAHVGAHGLGVVGRGGLAGADGPDGLVGDDHGRPTCSGFTPASPAAPGPAPCPRCRRPRARRGSRRST
jgi:aminoglycoside phosphotransferase family enzyme